MTEAATETKISNWSESAVRVLSERYLMRKNGVVVETPEEMCWRVALAIARAETNWGKSEAEILEIAGRFRDIMDQQLFMPNSPTLMNAGKDNGLQYSACYVLPVEDSLDGIFEAVKRAALIHKSGGGTGFAFSRLRSKDSIVSTTGGKASGPVSFMKVFNAATEAVKQGGTRRGANMGILRVDHPDILEFIDCKLDGGITNFNISVAATDAFMRAVDEDGEYDLVDPATGEPVRRLAARDVFQRIVEAAWRSGDPGFVFLDRVNAGPANPTPQVGQVEATNPCGEQPLLPNEACNLGSLNLARFITAGDKAELHIGHGGWPLDWAEMERVIRLCVRFLDDVIEVNPYPLPDIDHMVKSNRRIGLGVMGWADLLMILEIPYDSEDALALGGEIMEFINRIGHEESASLAVERGPFPNWAGSIYKDGAPLRNATITTIAPTGTISIIAGCTSGVEPLFAIAFRHVVGERQLNFVNPYFEKLARERGFYSDELMEKVARQGTLHGIEEVPEEVRRVFVTAHEVAPEWHVRMQAAFQKHTDNGVSKTVNLPNSALVEDVAGVYRLAFQEGCLGITVFRDGCKDTQVLHVGSKKSEPVAKETPSYGGYGMKIKPRPRFLQGVTSRAETPLGTAFVTVNRNGNNEPFEVFLNVGKAGSDTAAVSEAIGRLISLLLRLQSPLSPTERMKEIVSQLHGIGGGRTMGFGPHRVRSLPDAVAQVLAEWLGMADQEDGPIHDMPEALPSPVAEEDRGEVVTAIGDLCPECGVASLVYQEGCQKCHSCGFSEC
ncbi:MAG TPA: vitamin B12-dependent ribonucleotide reductase [Chloroflexota bacterium]|nr:vitamin B12-dependent ribonucleotide reductase [Chloroflexota bacterium]